MAKKQSKGAPKWMATFADMSTLLLTFFVLMLSFANIDIEKFRDLLGSVQDAFGVQTRVRGDFQAALDEQIFEADTLDNVPPAEEVVKQEMQKMSEQLDEVVEENMMQDQTEVKVGSNGVRIRITGHIMFDGGQADVKYAAYELLDGIAEAMFNYDYYLMIEGHTDSIPINTAQFPSNWELSSARASAVVRYLIDKGIDPLRLSGIGHGANYPIADNSTPEGRESNRRVEFIFTRTPFRATFDE